MAIKGSLKEASLPDVLQLLALGQKTGCLSIADRQNFGYIFFEKGRIIGEGSVEEVVGRFQWDRTALKRSATSRF